MRQDPGVGRLWVLWVMLMVMTQRQKERQRDGETGTGRQGRGQGGRHRQGEAEGARETAACPRQDSVQRPRPASPRVAEGCTMGHTWASRPRQAA